ncbi:MAG: aminotransferase class I/II-fold pyridoxal phosphate-dependent enzyme [Desulfobacterales bacterium]|nr:aminotransferase class I/II-fold pyridoxal phosphate-dependent enzyme [Desulfobacterales bacterium]
MAAWYSSCGLTVDPADIFLSASTSEAYGWLFKLLADPGDSVLVPKPGYPLFEYLAGLEGVESIPYPLEYRHPRGWRTDLDALESALWSKRPKAVVLIHPNNPTGSYVDPGERPRILELCRAAGAAVIADEVFLPYDLEDGPEPGFAGETGTPCFVLNGLSKLLGLPQMKLGWIVLAGPKEYRDEAAARLEIVADTYLSTGAPVLHAAPELLPRAPDFVRVLRSRLSSNLALLKDILEGELSPYRVLRCSAGWTAVLGGAPSRVGGGPGPGPPPGGRVFVHPRVLLRLPREALPDGQPPSRTGGFPGRGGAPSEIPGPPGRVGGRGLPPGALFGTMGPGARARPRIRAAAPRGGSMAAAVIDGKALAAEIREGVEAEGIGPGGAGVVPGLAVILVGEDPASVSYVTAKEKACAEAGMRELRAAPAGRGHRGRTPRSDTNPSTRDPAVHGILVQLPLPGPYRRGRGDRRHLARKGRGRLHAHQRGPDGPGRALLPPLHAPRRHQADPAGGVPTKGAHVVILGRSNIVGKPLANLLRPQGDRTPPSPSAIPAPGTSASTRRRADILIACAGKPGLVTADMVKPGACVIDVGVNRVEDPTSARGYRLVGRRGLRGRPRRGRLHHAGARRGRPDDHRHAPLPTRPCEQSRGQPDRRLRHDRRAVPCGTSAGSPSRRSASRASGTPSPCCDKANAASSTPPRSSTSTRTCPTTSRAPT